MKTSLPVKRNSGYMIMELLMALLVLSFVIRPVLVQNEDGEGHKTTKLEWELPMTQVLAQMGNLQNLIDRSWSGLDREFGYTGPSMGQRADHLMRQSLENGVVLMSAGFVDANGRFTGNFNNNADRFQASAEGMSVAFYDAARDGMRR